MSRQTLGRDKTQSITGTHVLYLFKDSDTRRSPCAGPGNKGRGIGPDQLGTTLIELLAVMSIIGTLVAVLVPSISTTKENGSDARVRMDASTVVTATIDYFLQQTKPEAPRTDIVTVTSRVNGKVVAGEIQSSNKWPETFITSNSGGTGTAAYVNELTTAASNVFDKDAHNLVIIDTEGTPIQGSDLLSRYAAVDFGALLAGGYLQQKPASADVLTRSRFHSFLWLLKKRASTGAKDIDASRNLEVFKLVPITGAGSTIELTHKQVF